MKRFAVAALATFVLVGLVMADEFVLNITKLSDDGSITGTKAPMVDKGAKKGGFGKGVGKGEEVTVKLAKGVKVFKGKFDADTKGLVAEGDDLKLTGLKSALVAAENGNVLVGGKGLSNTDKLELSVVDGKPAAKLNGSAIEFSTVTVKGKGPLATRVTTGDDGAVNTVIIGGGGGGGGFGAGKGKGKKGG